MTQTKSHGTLHQAGTRCQNRDSPRALAEYVQAACGVKTTARGIRSRGLGNATRTTFRYSPCLYTVTERRLACSPTNQSNATPRTRWHPDYCPSTGSSKSLDSSSARCRLCTRALPPQLRDRGAPLFRDAMHDVRRETVQPASTRIEFVTTVNFVMDTFPRGFVDVQKNLSQQQFGVSGSTKK